MTYILWSSDFASYLEDYLMEKWCTWDNGSVWLKDRPCKIYVCQWPIFHGPLILPYIIVRLKLFLYIKKWPRPGVFVLLRALALVVNWPGVFVVKSQGCWSTEKEKSTILVIVVRSSAWSSSIFWRICGIRLKGEKIYENSFLQHSFVYFFLSNIL